MLYSYNEVIKKYGNRYRLDRVLKNEEIFKVSHGVYSTKEYVDPFILLSYKYKNIIITLDSAFYYYDLTDVIPDKTYVVTCNNARRITEKDVIQTFMSDKLFNVGKTTIKIEGIDVFIYDKERLLIELIRNSNNIAFDYYKEIINNYRDIRDELNISKLNEYLDNFSNKNYYLKKIQMEVF